MTLPFESRLRQLQVLLPAHHSVLLSTPTDITYFTGFHFLVPEEREAFLLITSSSATLIKAHFCPYTETDHISVVNGCQPVSLATHLHTLFQKHQISGLFIDESSLFVNELGAIQEMLKTSDLSASFSILPFDHPQIWYLRMIKDPAEQDLLRAAGKIISRVFAEVPKFFKEGVTELELMHHVERLLREFGASGPAFPTIVAFGPHTASPHYQPAMTKLKKNTVVLIDAGAQYEGYRSDMTRTWWFGDTPSPKFQKTQQVVRAAYAAATQQLTPPHPIAQEVDRAARAEIEKVGWGDLFIHTTGHGVGLDIHEPPSINSQETSVLSPGMVITVEPGVYTEGEFGYRHENTILLTEMGFEELTGEGVQ